MDKHEQQRHADDHTGALWQDKSRNVLENTDPRFVGLRLLKNVMIDIPGHGPLLPFMRMVPREVMDSTFQRSNASFNEFDIGPCSHVHLVRISATDDSLLPQQIESSGSESFDEQLRYAEAKRAVAAREAISKPG
jgi:hypothetical protein